VNPDKQFNDDYVVYSRCSTSFKSDGAQAVVNRHKEKLNAARHWNYDNAYVKCPFKQFQRIQTQAQKPHSRVNIASHFVLLVCCKSDHIKYFLSVFSVCLGFMYAPVKIRL